jgi:hypothetical protein
MMSKQGAAREARRMFHLCPVDGVLDEWRVRQVVQAILKSRHRGYLLLLGYFQRLLEIDYLRHLAKVESATPVPSDFGVKYSGWTGAYVCARNNYGVLPKTGFDRRNAHSSGQ